MTTRETANGNLQNKLKVGSLFRSSSKSKVIKVSQDNTLLPTPVHGGGIYMLSGMRNEQTNENAFILMG